MYKVGGFRPEPKTINHPKYSSALFGSTPPMFEGESDLRPFSSPRHDQKTSNTCVAQSLIKALEIKRIQKYGQAHHVPLSVLDVYYGARDLMDPRETDRDEGTHMYLACEVLKRFGVCREAEFPFKEENIYRPPSIMATRESYLNKIKACYKIDSVGEQRIEDVKLNLQMGNPVVWGTTVSQQWFDYTAGSAPLGPVKWEDVKGRHATCIVGFMNGMFIIENSWGSNWGEDGFAYIEPEVIASPDSEDFWIICAGTEAYAESL